MGDETPDADEPAPPPPGMNKVEITIAGHTVVIESADPLIDVVGYALGLHQQTARSARSAPVGFDTLGGSFERADPYLEPGTGIWEDDDARRMGRLGPP